MLLTGLTIAGAAAVGALGGYAVYRGTRTVGGTRPVTKGLLTAAALFLWAAVTLPLAGVVVAGGIVLGLTLIPLVLAAVGVALLVSDRPRRQTPSPDTITV